MRQPSEEIQFGLDLDREELTIRCFKMCLRNAGPRRECWHRVNVTKIRVFLVDPD